jgi:hypothetical protein
MRFNICFAFALLALVALAVPCGLAASPASDDAFLGRWDITIAPAEKGRARYCWLELTKEGGTLQGRFNQGGGAVFPLKELAIENGELKFQHQFGRPADNLQAVYRARVVNTRLEGTATFGKQSPRALTGIRPPVWPAKLPVRKPGKPIELFNGKDMTGWLGQNTGKPAGWTVRNGIMVNDDHPPDITADNIYSETKYKDFRLEVEFNVHSQGALYGFIIPRTNASKPAGEWQKYEITLMANHVTVVLNGTRIIDNAEVPGITGGALDANEGEPGPIMLQGDHGLIQYRKVVLTPLK